MVCAQANENLKGGLTCREEELVEKKREIASSFVVACYVRGSRKSGSWLVASAKSIAHQIISPIAEFEKFNFHSANCRPILLDDSSYSPL